MVEAATSANVSSVAVGRNSPSEGGWELFPHDADIGIRGFGPTMEAAFEQGARALSAAITDPRRIAPRQVVEISCEGRDREFLFVEWLNCLVYEMATRHMLFSQFAVHVQDGHLRGRAWGEPVDVSRHAPAAEVKGATFTALEVRPRTGGGWLAQCVIDV